MLNLFGYLSIMSPFMSMVTGSRNTMVSRSEMLFFSGTYISLRHLLYLEISRFLEGILIEHLYQKCSYESNLQKCSFRSFSTNRVIVYSVHTWKIGFIEANKVSISLNLSSIYIIFTLCSLNVQAYYFTSDKNNKKMITEAILFGY